MRTQLDIDRNQKLMDATRAQVFSDVDSSYTTVNGAASLLDYQSTQAEYRSVQVNYLNLVATYLKAANQLNRAGGREVIP
jgi:outer membrane protein, heavy metal efflux system